MKQVQELIVSNADKEAAALLHYRDVTGKTLSESSDLLSNDINHLCDLISKSDDLWNDLTLRKKIFEHGIPQLLLEEAGSVDEVLARLPEAYSRSLFATKIATQYVYEGHDTQNVIELLEFLKRLSK